MLIWKPSPLAEPLTDQLALRVRDRVRAAVDLPGVPAGTEGKVIVANGFNWLRYWVLFDNGVELGELDGRQLEPTEKTAAKLAKRQAKAARKS